MQRPQKITFGEMRESGVRDVLIYCSDYRLLTNGPLVRWVDMVILDRLAQ